MDSRTDFQRLLEDMDRVIQSKRLELVELDERLEIARRELSEREAKELETTTPDGGDLAKLGPGNKNDDATQIGDHIRQQTKLYEQQVEQFGAELTELESINQELVRENELLRVELLRSQAKFDKLLNQTQEMGSSLQVLQATKLAMELKLSKAEGELRMQEKLLIKSHQEDEVLMDALNNKLDSLKREIEWRDEEIVRLGTENQFVMEAFGIATAAKTPTPTTRMSVDVDNDEQTSSSIVGLDNDNGALNVSRQQPVLEILNALREKDSQIELLKSQLLLATRDLERNASLLESLGSKLNRQLENSDSNNNNNNNSNNNNNIQSRQTNESLENLIGNENGELVSKKLVMLENELESKDRQLQLLEFRLHHYETILPNMMNDLLQELLVAHRSGRLQLTGSSNGKQLQVDGMNKIITTTTTNNNDKRTLPATVSTNDENSRGQELSLERLEIVIETLKRLSNGIDLAHGLMDQLESLKGLLGARETKIRQLVMDLNQMDAKFSLVQQQCDLFRHQTPHQSQPKRVSENQLNGNDEILLGGDGLIQVGCGGVENSNRIDMAKPPPGSLEGQVGREGLNGQQSIKTDLPVQDIGRHDQQQQQQQQRALVPCLKDDSIQLEIGSTNQARDESLELENASSSNGGSIKKRLDEKLANFGGGGGKESGLDEKEEEEAESMVNLNGFVKNNSTIAMDNNNMGQALKLQSHLRQLKNENELLELAMKEILLALKWTDGQCSSLLIDCPSLERLCQLIEARFLGEARINMDRAPGESPEGGCEREIDNGANLFQMVVLKSELDLLRGQNEQLRVDIKNQRRDYHELLRACQFQQQVNNSSEHETTTSRRLNEASCQTDHVMMMMVVGQDGDDSHTRGREAAGCQNCTKLAKLTGYLSQSIVRIETRVSVSDETYINRVVNLHQLIRVLERDLSVRENLLNGSRRECHLLAQQRLMLEARLQFVENQLSNHMSVCPMSHLKPNSENYTNSKSNGCGKLQIFTAARNGNGDSIRSLTIQQSEGEPKPGPRAEPRLMKNARMTISLLQSIINCLQARLDFKDERLQQLESLIIRQNSHQSNMAN